ncbi:MAG: XrtA/PEP-CTERM system exopolysaccharide export protein [Geminicoccaceae bacterium]
MGQFQRYCFAILTAAILSFGLTACQSLPDPPKLSDEDVLAQPDYRIAPGDTVGVSVWRSPELTKKVPVRPDGKISLPLAGELRAAGQTPLELSAAIEKALMPFVQLPKVSVAVEAFADGGKRTVQVLGEVKQPTAVAYRPYLTVLDLIAAAGGLTEFADGNSSKLIRRGEKGGGEAYGLSLEDLVSNGNLQKNARLQPGDLVIVPSSAL